MMLGLSRSSTVAVQYFLLAITFAACHSNSESMGRLEWHGFVDCPESLTVVSNELLARPPYMEKKANSTAYQGLMPIFLEMMLNECCKLSSNLVFVDSEGDANLTLPILLNVNECRLNHEANLVPMLPNTGVAFVVIKGDKGNHSMKLLNSLVGTWPVLVLTLILSVIAGIIAWALDTGKNPEDFPRTFTKGSWEGFWWAFVSMTTVGYGDRCPRSFRGRLFAVVWILVGMCICSIFTATLTTSLTTVSLNTKLDLAGAKVVTLLDSLESITGFQRQADMKRVKTARDMHEQLETGDVQGALMDAYFLLHYKANFPTKNLRVQEVIPSNLEYGVKVKHSELMSCFRNKRSTMESSFYEYAELQLQQSLTSRLGDEGDELDNLFDPQGLLFYPTLFTCLGVTAVLLLVGGVWDMCRLVTSSWTSKERPKGFSFILTRINCGHPSHSTSFYMSHRKLKRLESKVTDLSRMVEAIKDELALNKQAERSCRNENFIVDHESCL